MCESCFRKKIKEAEGLYRENLNIDAYVKFYYMLIFSINENIRSEREAFALEMSTTIPYRAMATDKALN
jgi:hypothetical protein